MGFWGLLFIGGLVVWTACVFLRAVAARACQLRLELAGGPHEEPVTVHPVQEEVIVIQPDLPAGAPTAAPPRPASSASGRPSANGHGKGSAAGNGQAKTSARRSGA